MNDKITPAHLERAAYIYIRQSTLHQVRNNLESNRRQYDFQARAQQLGFTQIVVIDDDLGITAEGSKERPGFGRLLTAVCEGRAGAVFAIEASRLARNNRDWHHLIDLCVLTGTLVIDADGIYDPRLLNDRLLLGLKGTMSEFELGILRQRALEAFREKVRRGEVLCEVAIGYVRTEDNRLEMIPDRQVQETIRGVFAQFRRLGTVRQVLLWYRQENMRMCSYRRQGSALPQVVWEMPSYRRIWRMLKNPVYAGAFAYGRTRTRSQMIDGRARKTGGHTVPVEQWDVLIQNHHPGYITWEEYLENQRQLAGNLTKHHGSTKGAAKSGPALLTGLLRCARCGRKLHVSYSGQSGQTSRYQCRGGNLNHGVKMCISFGGLRPDQAVSQMVLDALQPVGVEAALRAYDMARQEDDLKTKALALALEKARYESERARRQYDAVEPENRLVATELEARWNVALNQVSEAEAKLVSAQSGCRSFSVGERARLLELGSNLQALWDHPQTPLPLKKRILRTVIEEIVAEVDEQASEIVLRIHWAGGTHTVQRVKKNRTGQHGLVTDREVVEVVRQLAKMSSDASIALVLNRLGYETGAGNKWTQSRVCSLRDYHEIPCYDTTQERKWITMSEAAEQLKVSAATVRVLIRQGLLPAKQVVRGAPWMIDPNDLKSTAVQQHIATVHAGKRSSRCCSDQTVMCLL